MLTLSSRWETAIWIESGWGSLLTTATATLYFVLETASWYVLISCNLASFIKKIVISRKMVCSVINHCPKKWKGIGFMKTRSKVLLQSWNWHATNIELSFTCNQVINGLGFVLKPICIFPNFFSKLLHRHRHREHKKGGYVSQSSITGLYYFII